MILCIDVGNTNIVVGCYGADKQIFQSRISTDISRTSDQYAVELHGILRLHGIEKTGFNGAIISSVVPALTTAMANAVKTVTGAVPMTVGRRTKTGLSIKLDNPAELGGDLAATAVAAKVKYPLPCVILDMGTATTIFVLAENGDFLGGAIVPGMKISMESLVSKTSLLIGISLDAPPSIIGTNTADSMKSGAVFGNAAMIDGMCHRIAQHLGQQPTVVATGGLSPTIVPHCETDIILDDNLLMDGLRMIYERNQ